MISFLNTITALTKYIQPILESILTIFMFVVISSWLIGILLVILATR